MARLALPLCLLLFLALPGAAAAQERDPDDPIVVITGGATVEAGETVGGVYVLDGPVRIAGTVDGDVFVVSGRTELAGEVTGDLTVVAEPAVLADGARVGGDLRYGEEEPEIAAGATVEGEVSEEDLSGHAESFVLIGRLAFWLAVSISTLALGLLLLLLVPRAADAALRVTRERPWESAAAGLATFFLLPILAVLALATLVGLPLGIALLLALLPLAVVAYVTTLWVVGRLIVKPPRGRVASFLAGWAIFRALALIPILGFFLWLTTIAFGLGVLALALWRARSAPPPPAPEEPVPA